MIKPNLKNQLIFRILDIMKTILYNDKLIDFFRRNTGRKSSIVKAWKRERRTITGPFIQEAREDGQKWRQQLPPRNGFLKPHRQKNEAGETLNSSILRLWKPNWDIRMKASDVCDFCEECAKSLQSCPTPCDPVDCSPPGSSVHGMLRAKILEWVAMPSSRGSSWPRDQIRLSYASSIGRRDLYH